MIQENDIIIENSDVKIVNGDFDIGDANSQNIKHLCIADAGNYVISAKTGAGIYRFQNKSSYDIRGLLSTIASELKQDGYKYPEFSQNESGAMDIKAIRTKKPRRFKI